MGWDESLAQTVGCGGIGEGGPEITFLKALLDKPQAAFRVACMLLMMSCIVEALANFRQFLERHRGRASPCSDYSSPDAQFAVYLSRTLNVYAMPIPLVAEILDEGLSNIPYASTVLKTLPWLALIYLLKTYFGGASNRSERVMHSKVIMMTVYSSNIKLPDSSSYTNCISTGRDFRNRSSSSPRVGPGQQASDDSRSTRAMRRTHLPAAGRRIRLPGGGRGRVCPWRRDGDAHRNARGGAFAIAARGHAMERPDGGIVASRLFAAA